MNRTSLQRLGQLVIALVLAVFISWIGLAYQAWTASSDSVATDLQLRQVSTLLVDANPAASPANMLDRTDWTPSGLPLSFGWSEKILWTRLLLENTSSTTREVWLEVTPRRLTHLRLHEQTAAGVWRLQTSGVAVAARDRQVELSELVFPLTLLAGEKRELLLEVQSSTTALNLTFMLHDPQQFLGVTARTNLLDLLLIGGILSLGTLSLCIGLAYGQGVQLLLGLRSLMIGGWLLQQLGFLTLVLPGNAVTWLAGYTVWMANITLVLTTAFVWMFLSRTRPEGLPRAVNLCFFVLLVLPLMHELLALAGWRRTELVGPFLAVAAASTLAFTLPVSAALMWKGHLSAATVLVTSLGALLLNTPLYLAVWGLSPSEVVRQFISPIPVLITSSVFYIGTTLQLVRERRASRATRAREQREALARLEGMVAERTLLLQEARDEAERANAAKSVFMAKVSHELRTPLHTVLGYLNLALRDQPPAPVVRKLEVSRRAGEQLVVHIDGLLDFARMEHNQLALVKTPWMLADLLADVSERTHLLAEDHGNHFVCELAPNPDAPIAALMGDPVRLQQVLMILLSNAMRYTERGMVTLRVSATALQDQAAPGVRLRFVVKDTGRGITADALARIFTLFGRGDSTDRIGLGLGLPIAQQLLTLMDSHLDVSSQPGVGSEFAFTMDLPLAVAQPHVPLLAASTSEAPCRFQAYEGRVRHVLVLDDLPEGRQYLQELLEGLGFQVTAVAARAEAVAAWQPEAAWDLCIIDQQLAEGETGWDFALWLQSESTLPLAMRACPLLMLSAASPEPAVGLVLPRGVDRHLLKPASDTVLMDSLAVLMGLHWRPLAPQAVKGLAVAPIVMPADWFALQVFAAQGDVSGLNQWALGQADVAATHPVLNHLIQRLDFAGITSYAAGQASELGGADGTTPAQVR